MFYVNPMVMSKKTYSKGIKDKRRESKHTTMENYQPTKKNSKRGRKEQRNYKTARTK